jgi:uncharacterized membrane protein
VLRFALRSTLTDARATVGEAGMNPVPIGDWANCFVAEVGASAALTGLIVVAISVNLSKILAYEQLRRRAAEPLVMLVGVLTITSLGLVPGQPFVALGLEALVVGVAMFAVPLTLPLRWFRRASTRSSGS